MTEQHHPAVRSAQTEDDEGKGVEAIIRAFVKNPVAGLKVVGFIGALYGMYYALNYKIDDAKASSEQHYKDTTVDLARLAANNSLELARATEKLSAKLDAFSSTNDSQTNDIKALFGRGDTRWALMTDKQVQIEVRFTKVEDKLDYVIQYITKHDVAPSATR